MAKRRSSEAIRDARQCAWDAARLAHALYGACSVCDRMAHVRSQRRESVKCYPCHMQHAKV